MKFAIVLFAALAVVSASAPESESSDVSLVEKLSKWFSYQIPLFAPIRTTTRRPAPAATRPTTRRPTTRPTPRPTTRRTTTTTTQAPTTESVPEQPEESSEQPQGPLSAEVMNALANLYQMEGLKDQLPPMSDILNVDPAQQEMFNKPVGELADEFTMNLLQSVMNYINSKPPGSVNLDDPIDLTSDGNSV